MEITKTLNGFAVKRQQPFTLSQKKNTVDVLLSTVLEAHFAIPIPVWLLPQRISPVGMCSNKFDLSERDYDSARNYFGIRSTDSPGTSFSVPIDREHRKMYSLLWALFRLEPRSLERIAIVALAA